ncbi:MAG: hypothetical protein WBD62_08140, partial [Anaerolineales bacterium]
MRKFLFKLIVPAYVLLLLVACTFNIGSPSRLPDPPAPTAIALLETAAPLPDVPGKAIALPPGFEISVFADGLDGPRMMTTGPDGQVFV